MDTPTLREEVVELRSLEPKSTREEGNDDGGVALASCQTDTLTFHKSQMLRGILSGISPQGQEGVVPGVAVY